MDGFVKFRAASQDAARWRAAASRLGLTLSDFLRSWADLGATGHADPEAVARELAALRRDFNSGAGNNLNQLAAHLNRLAKAGSPPADGDLRRAAEAVEAAREALAALKGDVARVLAHGVQAAAPAPPPARAAARRGTPSARPRRPKAREPA